MKKGLPTANIERGFRLITRALRYRNYRTYFIGQGVSLIGTWIQWIAMSWLVYRITNSALIMGVVGFAGQIPTLFLLPISGVYIDRASRHRILMATQFLAMWQALILATLVLTGSIEVWHILVLSVFLGVVNSFDLPARQSFIVEMIENRDDLGNAIALNSAMFNGARLIGPSIGGILIAIMGEGLCFLANGLSFTAVLLALLSMHIERKKAKDEQVTVVQGIREGFTYAYGHLPIRTIILLVALVSLMGMPYSVLMPIFAKDILHGGPQTLGLLMGATGLGALIGALYLATRKGTVGLVKIIAMTAFTFGAGLVGFALSNILWLSMLFMLMAGFGMMVQLASSNTILQTVVEDSKRGRVMSFYTMAFMGIAPFGSLLAGSLANQIGAPYTLLIGGTACMIGALLFARMIPKLRKAASSI